MLLGRDRERAEIWALLEAARSSRSGVLVLRGEAGIGKSALIEDARDRATDMHVLAARGVESEAELPYAAVHQLLRPALSNLHRVPAPQAAALESALGLGRHAAEERFLVFAGCLSLLSELAENRPVLCLIDDAHWLDAASSDALQFVARCSRPVPTRSLTMKLHSTSARTRCRSTSLGSGSSTASTSGGSAAAPMPESS